MKRKRQDWDDVPWTPLVPVEPNLNDPLNAADPPSMVYRNAIYQVTVYAHADGPWGPMLHLSFKTHDRSARHDWREMQRIKNEIAGPEAEAVELFPAESRLVDGANQYHLFCFRDRLPFGFGDRLVAEGSWRGTSQRPFKRGERPADCIGPAQFEEIYQARLKAKKEKDDEARQKT